ncbi:MurR/RpiR family transcriptional regulator [Sedimentimonas flavescens]|uniref:MurR/RpiR family transcriptional regulator n=1 Tax=Sedimentimonas flavescens TaxID=2851012 RepID=A0ABT3A2J5_9RHOB|nr:MurR/RpiR family transcriptional regulator [Sedimentimonas flavescens]MCV2880168.1 MurR/RpiR family transcriptional regulator [Sedimentimonas flavescens]
MRTRLVQAAETGSPSMRAIASFMLAQFSDLPFETAATLAAKIEVSEVSIGRFCRAIGYANFKDLKDHLKDDIGEQPWLIKDRLQALRSTSGQRDERLSQGLEAEMAGLVGVYELARTPEWQAAVERFTKRARVLVTGFQTERGLAQYFASQMQYVRPGVQLVDLSAGNFAEVLVEGTAPQDTCLAIFEARRYSRQALVLAREAKARGIAVTIFTDRYCAWGADYADEVFMVATQFNQFWDSTAHLALLGNLMINDIFLARGEGAEARLNEIARLYGAFTGHVGNPLTPVAQ